MKRFFLTMLGTLALAGSMHASDNINPNISPEERNYILAKNVADGGYTYRNVSEMISLSEQINNLASQGQLDANLGNIKRCTQVLLEVRPLIDRFNVLAQEVGIPEWIADGNRMFHGWNQSADALNHILALIQ